MAFNELQQKFGPAIDEFMRQHSQEEARAFLHSRVQPLIAQYADLYSPEFLLAFESKNWSELKHLAPKERDRLDSKADSEDAELAGMALEMAGYLAEDQIDTRTVFNFVYCWGVFASDQDITRALTSANTP